MIAAGEMLRTKLLHSLLRVVLLVGLLPLSNHMPAMHTLRMEEAMTSSAGGTQGKVTTKNTNENSASSCCDAICPFSLTCAFVLPQSGYAAVYGASDQISYSAFVVRSIYLQVAIPPPKA